MLIKKMLRDIQRNKVQFMAIFLMMFCGCFLFSGITGEWNGLKSHFEQYIIKQNLADVWVFKQNVTDEDVEKLKEDKRITDVEERLVLPMVPQNNKEASLDCYVTEENNISKLCVREGIPFDSGKDGVWLDALFAKENDYKLGDKAKLNYQGIGIEGKILGLVYSPEYIYGALEGQMMPEHKNNGFAFLSPGLLNRAISGGTGASAQMTGMLKGYNQLAVKTEQKQGKEFIRSLLGDSNIMVIEASDHPSVSMIKDEIDQHKTIGTAFSAAFLLIAVMIAMTTMHRMLKNQKTQIGILKALGFGRGPLIIHYVSHNGAICLLGALSGCMLGYRFLPGLIYRFMRQMYVLPEWGGSLPPIYMLLPLGCSAFCIVISFFICRKYLKPDAATILYGEETAKHAVNLPGLMESLDFSGRWNMRDIARNRLRSFMTLCGIIGCTALLFCAFALYDTFENLSSWTFTKQQEYQCKITELPGDDGQKEILSMTDGEYLMEGNAVILKGGKTDARDKTAGEEKEVALTVPETTRYMKLYENLKTAIGINGGVALSKKTADSLGLHVGDFITWKAAGEKAYTKSEIKAVVRTPLSQGIIMMKSDYEKTGQNYAASAIVGKEPEGGFGSYADQCIISYQKDLTQSVDSMMEGMVTMIMLLVTGAVILGSVMLYNLGVLSYLERYREFATMKVLGFADKKIRKIMIQQNVWLSAAGILLGIPAGYGLLYYMLSTIPDSMDIIVYIRALSFVFSVAGTLVLSWIISKVVSRKIPRINMVEALKARE